MRKPGPTQRRGETDPLSRFLAYLRDIELALAHREPMRITALLRKRTATHLPREVREELLMVSRAPRATLRAPVQFLRFQHRMTELARGGEALPTAQTALDLDPSGENGAVRRRARDEQRPAASDPIERLRDDD